MRNIIKQHLFFLIFFSAIFFGAHLSQCQASDSGQLYPILMNDKWGFMDKTGKVAINPQFVREGEFSEGLAFVQIDQNKYGYIDKKGKVVFQLVGIPDVGENFHEGVAQIRYNQNLKYIDQSGRILFEAALAMNFNNGLAPNFDERAQKWGFINKSGKYAISPQFDWVTSSNEDQVELLPFSEGLEAVMIHKKWGYINPAGKWVVEPKFDLASPFSEGLASVAIKRKWGYIDKTGNWVITPQFDSTSPFSEGMARVIAGEQDGYIDKTGKFVLMPRFKLLITRDFKEGLVAAQFVDSAFAVKWGFMDKTGKVVIPPRFETATTFQDGLARVQVADKIGYIDKAGQYVWTPTK